MSNINDIFEGKKSCLSLLNESSLYGYSITNQGMDYDQCMEYHTEMIKESTQEILQWEADWYKNDLIIEEAMYENFIEEDIKEMIMEGLGDAIRSGIEKIKALLNKLKEWMLSVLRAIKDIFSATEDAAEKAEKKIKDKMKKGELSASDKVEALVYKDIDAAGKELEKVIDDIGNLDDAMGETAEAKDVFSKDMWLKGIGVSSVSELLEKTRKIFLPSQEKRSITIDQAIKLGSSYITKAEVQIKKLEASRKMFTSQCMQAVTQIQRYAAGKDSDGEFAQAMKDEKEVYGVDIQPRQMIQITHFSISCMSNVIRVATEMIKQGNNYYKNLIVAISND